MRKSITRIRAFSLAAFIVLCLSGCQQLMTLLGLTHTLTVVISPIESGSVTKNPNLTYYTDGTNVQLSASGESGWVFLKWEGDLSGSTNPATLYMDSDKSVTAKFVQSSTGITYMVTYDGNGATGGNVPVDTATYQQGLTIMVLGNTGSLVKTNYGFAGWNTKANGSGTNYSGGATFTLAAPSMTLYAVWIPDGMTFTSSGSSITITGYTTLPSGPMIIAGGVTAIGNLAFSGSTSPTGVTIPEGVISIGYNAFYGCPNVSVVTLPTSLSGIGDWAFGNCASLASVTIPAGVATIGIGVFADCPNLISINVDPANPNFTCAGGVLFDKAETVLLAAPEGGMIGTYSIPSGVATVGNNAFFSCNNLTGIVIPSSTTTIASFAFSFCQSLSTISVDPANANFKMISGVLFSADGTMLIYVPNCGVSGIYQIPQGVTGIVGGAFSGCDWLTGVTIPSSLTYISKEAFVAFNGLTEIAVPSTVSGIGDSAFAKCKNLVSVVVEATTPPVMSSKSKIFATGNLSLLIHVPAGTVDAYKAALGWSTYAAQIVSP